MPVMLASSLVILAMEEMIVNALLALAHSVYSIIAASPAVPMACSHLIIFAMIAALTASPALILLIIAPLVLRVNIHSIIPAIPFALKAIIMILLLLLVYLVFQQGLVKMEV